MEILQWALDNGCRWGDTCAEAASGGHLDILQWLHDNEFPLNKKVCSRAALSGHLEIIKWAYNNDCSWSTDVCSNAAFSGHLEIIKWARDNGCPLWPEEACYKAAAGGHLHVLQWLIAERCNWNADTCAEAAKNGHFHILKWARDKRCPWNYMTMEGAFQYGDTEMITWLRDNGCPWNDNVLGVLLTNEKLLKWAILNGFSMSANTYNSFVERGKSLELLEWLYNAGIRPNEESLRYAHSISLDMVMWLYNKGVPWPKDICMNACDNDRLDILKYAIETGCSCDLNEIAATACFLGFFDILKWAKSAGLEWNPSFCNSAARARHFTILKWLRDNGCPWDISVSHASNLELLKYIYENNGPVDTEYIIDKSLLFLEFDVIDWFISIGEQDKVTMLEKKRTPRADITYFTWLHKYGRLSVENFKSAIKTKELKMVQWLHANGCPWNTEVSTLAAKWSLKIFFWLVENGCPWSEAELEPMRNIKVNEWMAKQGCKLNKD